LGIDRSGNRGDGEMMQGGNIPPSHALKSYQDPVGGLGRDAATPT